MEYTDDELFTGLTMTELSKKYHISRTTIRSWINRGIIDPPRKNPVDRRLAVFSKHSEQQLLDYLKSTHSKAIYRIHSN